MRVVRGVLILLLIVSFTPLAGAGMGDSIRDVGAFEAMP
jgi:hypothetical protein